MMAESKLPVLLLINVVAGMLSVSGRRIISKYICPGDSVQAFENIDFDRCNANVTLNLNGDKNIEIAKWSVHNCTPNETNILTEFKGRVFLDQNGTLTIHSLHRFDQGRYVVVSRKDTLPSIQEVQIKVMVAPKLDCKPEITQFGEKLFVSLKLDVCGDPLVTTYWKGYDGGSDSNEQMLKITPGDEARTYEACIKGPSLQCSQSLTPHNYCVSFITERTPKLFTTQTFRKTDYTYDTNGTMSTSSSSTDVFIPVIVVLIIMLIITIVILIIKFRRDSLLLGYIKKLLTHDQQQYLEAYSKSSHLVVSCCTSNLRSVSNTQRQVTGTHLEKDSEMIEVETEHQSFIKAETNRASETA